MEKAKLADAAWALLADKPFGALTMSEVAAAAEMSLAEVVLHGGDITDLIVAKLEALDITALAQSADDFADDPHASIYEKILEGLMMRFELLAPYRAQFDALHDGAKRQPLLGLHLAHQLSHSVGKLLYLAGDESQGAIKQARILGVVGVLLRVRPVWSQDEGADLGLTLKALDDELKKACEWAVSLRVLSRDDVMSHGESEGDE